MESWIRLAVFILILFSFLRRIAKVKSRPNILPNLPREAPPASTGPFSTNPASTDSISTGPFSKPGSNRPPDRITPTFSRPRYGKKNDFRDVPPPPENPQLG
jgi:hypothetical protein